MNQVYIHPYNYSGDAINTTSRATGWSKGLSPFYLGPVALYNKYISQNFENAWQYSKVYEEDVDDSGNPSSSYWTWAESGWNKKWADRFPKGKGAKPLYSYWNGEKLNYIEARKKIYCPLYARAVIKTKAYQKLKELFLVGDLHLRDFDGYDYHSLNMTLDQVLNCQNKKMGHAFVIAMLLQGERVWE